jgi:hypothetical protein
MTVDEFDLLVRAIHRAYIQDPKCINFIGNSIYYHGTPDLNKVGVFISGNLVWPTLQDVDFEVKPPWIWSFKSRKRFNSALSTLNDMQEGRHPDVSAESLICKCIPLAKDIIAEKALVGDHGNKASNNST